MMFLTVDLLLGSDIWIYDNSRKGYLSHSSHTADSKPVKQEVSGTVILHPLAFPAFNLLSLPRFTEVFATILVRHLQLGDYRSAGAAIYVEAILQYLRLSPSMMSRAVKALPDYIPFAIRHKVLDKFVPNM
jgi:hypothetical protein